MHIRYVVSMVVKGIISDRIFHLHFLLYFALICAQKEWQTHAWLWVCFNTLRLYLFFLISLATLLITLATCSNLNWTISTFGEIVFCTQIVLKKIFASRPIRVQKIRACSVYFLIRTHIIICYFLKKYFQKFFGHFDENKCIGGIMRTMRNTEKKIHMPIKYFNRHFPWPNCRKKNISLYFFVVFYPDILFRFGLIILILNKNLDRILIIRQWSEELSRML